MTDDPSGFLPHTDAAAASRERTLGLIAVIASIAIVSVTFGITSPLLSILLERQGVDSVLIGMTASCSAAGFITFAPLLPRAVRRFGTANVMLGCIAAVLFALILLPLFPNVWAWAAIRFFYGICSGGLFVVSETWINQLAPAATRGRVLGLYVMSMSIGLALGPLVLWAMGTDTTAPFFAAMLIVVVGAVPVVLARRLAPRIAARPTAPLWRFLRIAPTGTFAGLVLGFVETSVLSLLPLYALRSGFPPGMAAVLISVFTAGAIVIPPFFGWLGDRIALRSASFLAALIAGLSIASFPLVTGSPLLWVAAFIWGGAATSIYSLGLTLLGERFRGADLVAVNAVMIFMYSIGSLSGAILTGAAMDIWGTRAYPGFLAVVCLSYALLVGVRRMTHGKRG